MNWRDDFQPLLKLMIPLLFTGMIGGLVYFFETLFLAKLGSKELAAGALVSWLYNFFLVIVYGILGSINIVVAHLYGRKDIDEIIQVIRDGLILAFILFVPTFILFWNMGPIFGYLGQKEELITLAIPFLHALAWGLLPNLVFAALIEPLIGLGHIKGVVVFTSIVVFLTICLSYCFIFGSFGFPSLGVSGAGWGISIGILLATIGLLSYLYLSPQYRNYFFRVFNLKPITHLNELMHIGLPLGLMYCVEVGFFFLMTLFIGTFGHELLAANQIALQYLGALIGGIFSLAQAITVRMGHLMGARNYNAANKVCFLGVIISVSFICIFSILDWFFPKWLISLDFNIDDVNHVYMIHHASKFLLMAGIFQILEAIRVALFGALRALKETKFTLKSSFVTFVLIALPLGLILESLANLQGLGIWAGLIISTLLSIVWLFSHYKKRMDEYIAL